MIQFRAIKGIKIKMDLQNLEFSQVPNSQNKKLK